MFETVGLTENLNTIEGLKLLRDGLHLMEEHNRKPLVLQVANTCKHLPEKLRFVAYEIFIKALELQSHDTSEPPSKRLAGASTSLILGAKDAYTTTVLEALSRGMGEVKGVGGILHEELAVRFCESFYLAMLKQTEYKVNLAAILDIFFQGLGGEKLSTKLRGDPIEISETMAANISKLNDFSKEEEIKVEGVNVTMTLEEVLHSLLRFSEGNTKAAISLLTQLIKLLEPKRPGFDFASTLGSLIVQSLDVTEWVMMIAKYVDLWECYGLKQAIDKLVKVTKGSEDENISKLLEEEYKIRSFGPEQFVLGSHINYDIDMPQVSRKFSINDLVATFGQLSNWDNLTMQQKNSVKMNLPPLWTNRENIKTCFENYNLSDGPIWMKCMLASKRLDGDVNYLKDVDKWPRKMFDISAVSEILEIIKEGIDAKDVYLRCDIQPSECLAEWAARIMIRSTYLNNQLSRSHALSWCELASEKELYAQVLECCKMNIDRDLYESETLKWFRQRVLALRGIALERNDSHSLRDTLNLAVTYTPQFIENSSFGDILGMNEVILTLRKDLKSLNKDHIESAMQDIKHKLQEDSNVTYDKKVLKSVCVTALTFYDQLWETSSAETQKDLLLNMSKVLGLMLELDIGDEALMDVIINRLDDVGDELGDEVALHLLDTLQLIIKNLNTISLDQLKSKIDLFKKYEDHATFRSLQENEGVLKYKMCLNLIGDAEHLLMQYCAQCIKVLDDKQEWTKVFKELKKNIFENPYAGPDYQVLDKYKIKLYDIADFDSTDKQTKKRILSTVQSELSTKRDSISLSHICPALSVREVADDALDKLLCLKPGVNVFRFEEKIPIFTDSIRRPAVLRVRLSDGTFRRYIIKRGERARTHCAAVRLLATVQGGSGYNVSQLSDDCALIEYLEDHERFRSLISSHYPVDDAITTMTRARGKDTELILAPSSALRHFEELCSRVPCYVLRSAVEENSASLQDFIWKKSNFLEALCSMTIFSYLCAVSDRHLENLMYNIQDGGACHVDCGAILQYGGPEIPPARLTRNILALCDTQVLESRLQTLTQSLRQNSGLILPSISIVFKWMGDVHMEKQQYIKTLIRGKSLSHLTTIDALSKSAQPYKEKYIELLEDIFVDFDEKDSYSVEEQVSSLLRQCTEPRILSVTRSGWEPWI